MSRNNWNISNKFEEAFFSSICAGAAIGLGATAYLCVGGVIGAFLFATGLFIIVEKHLQLFTGRMCRILLDDVETLVTLPYVFVGNMIGAIVMGYLIRFCHIETSVNAIVAAKEEMFRTSWAAILCRGILCNICIYLATRGYRAIQSGIGRYIALFLGVAVFVLIGADHCVADMFYAALSTNTTIDMFLVVLLAAVGNCIGGTMCEMFSLWVEED